MKVALPVVAGLALAIAANPLPAQAGASVYFNGSQLLEWCSGDPATADGQAGSALCVGYIAGAADMFAAMEEVRRVASGGRDRPLACMSATQVSLAQLRDIVVTFLRQQPGQLNSPAPDLVFEAIRRSYPCAS